MFFYNNLVSEGGGAVRISNNSNILLNDNISIKFTNNSAAQYGGAIFLDAAAIIAHDSNENFLNFDHNMAEIQFIKKHLGCVTAVT